VKVKGRDGKGGKWIEGGDIRGIKEVEGLTK